MHMGIQVISWYVQMKAGADKAESIPKYPSNNMDSPSNAHQLTAELYLDNE